MKKLFTLLMLMICICNVKAYECDYFNIDIPNGYKEETMSGNNYKWTKDNNYIAITISDNTELYDIKNYSEEDIQTQKSHMENTYNEGLKKYNIKVEISNIKKELINNNYYLTYNIYWPTKELTGYDMYQIGSAYTTQNYIYTLTYSSDESINNNEEYNALLSSFDIKDETIKTSMSDVILASIVIVGVIGAIVTKLIQVIKKRK